MSDTSLFVIVEWPHAGGWPDVRNEVFESADAAQRRIDDLVREREDMDGPDPAVSIFVTYRLVEESP